MFNKPGYGPYPHHMELATVTSVNVNCEPWIGKIAVDFDDGRWGYYSPEYLVLVDELVTENS
jgi:hypothetical protein